MNVTIIRTNGATEQHEIAGRSVLSQICKLIGADCTDTVNLRGGLVMFVDDNGYETRAEERPYGVELVPVRARKAVNEQATKLYHSVCRPGVTHQIVGDVAIVHDAHLA